MVWNLSDEEDTAVNRLGMVHHGRTRKHCHLFRSYGDLDNEKLVLQYGFTRMANPADRVSTV